jgi:glutathione S-transferase
MDMHKLTQYRLCPFSRSVRLALDELGIACELADERPWEWRASFLQLNPAGELPVLQLEAGPILCGAYAISEYLADSFERHPVDGRSVPLFPGNRDERAETRRLVDWFHRKLDREVTRELLQEKVYTQATNAGAAPDAAIMRAIRRNLRYHLSYVSYLAEQRRWLAGEELSFADLAAAGHFATIDYLGEVPWEEYEPAKEWYVRVKSRRSFRPLLADRVPGLPPPLHYTDLDF